MATWILLIGIPIILGLWAQMQVSSAFGHWKQIPSSANITGAETAQQILKASNINDVEIVAIENVLGDHYDPTGKRLCLSPDVYNGTSIAAVGIAAHEVGHAIQHAKAYAPLQWRMAIVPATQFASQILPFIIFGGFIFHAFRQLIFIGIICYLVITLFQLITLPVEFDASRRAKIILQQLGIIQSGEEAIGVNKVLDAAALTYVAAFVAALSNLIYLLILRQEDR